MSHQKRVNLTQKKVTLHGTAAIYSFEFTAIKKQQVDTTCGLISPVW